MIDRLALFIRLLTSPRVAFTLVSALTISVVLRYGLGIASDAALPAALVALLLVLTSVSILASAFERSRWLLLSRTSTVLHSSAQEEFSLSSPLPLAESLQRAEETLVPKGLRLHGSSPAILVRTRGSAGPWGSILFHLGLVLVFAGAIISTLCSFSAMFALTAGESAFLGAERLRLVSNAPLATHGALRETRVTLLEFDRMHRLGTSTTPSSLLLVEQHEARVQGHVYVNNALDMDGTVIHQGDLWGYAAGLHITGANDSVVFSGFLRIATDLSEREVRFRDSVRLSDGALLHVAFFPDADSSGGSVENRSLEARRPLLLGSLRTRSGETHRFGIRPDGEEHAGNYTIAFPMLRFWSQYTVGVDPGIPLLAAGGVACVLGLLLRMLFRYTCVFVTLAPSNDGTSVTVRGLHEKSDTASEEVREITDALAESLACAVGAPSGHPVQDC